jgi:hypothetical protein
MIRLNPAPCASTSPPTNPDENDVRAYATFFCNVFSNGIAELTCGDIEPIDCEVVIPVNMMMTVSADQTIAKWSSGSKKELAAEGGA